ncbi:MAG: ABC transporter ATP-binding protein [Planctomycetota bacterium]
MTRLRLDDLWKSYAGEFAALTSFNMEVEAGERIALVGPSGSGKSTLLRLVAGLEQASRGRIRFNDRDMSDVEPKDRGVAMVFQRDALWPHLNVQENLSFGGERMEERARFPRWFTRWRSEGNSAEIRPAEKARGCREIIESLEIASLLDRFPRELSGGERQRVSLARALIRRPRLCLFDEPLTYLDAVLRTSIRRVLVNWQSTNQITSLLVTHDPVEAMAFGQRVAVLVAGRIRQFASPRELYESPADAEVAQFSGENPVGFIRGTFLHEQGQYQFVAEGGRITFPSRPLPLETDSGNRELVLGVRAEHLQTRGATRESRATRLDSVSFEARVEGTEFRGNRSLVSFTTGGGRLYAIVGNEERLAAGELVFLEVETRHLMYFEGSSKAPATAPKLDVCRLTNRLPTGR